MKKIIRYLCFIFLLVASTACICSTKYSPEIIQNPPVARQTNHRIGLIVPITKKFVNIDTQVEGDTLIMTNQYVADVYSYPYSRINIANILPEYCTVI